MSCKDPSVTTSVGGNPWPGTGWRLEEEPDRVLSLSMESLMTHRSVCDPEGDGRASGVEHGVCVQLRPWLDPATERVASDAEM